MSIPGRRINFLSIITMDGEKLTEKTDIKEGMVSALQIFFVREGGLETDYYWAAILLFRQYSKEAGSLRLLSSRKKSKLL